VSELASAVARFAAYPAPHFIWFAESAVEAVGREAAEQLQAQAQAKVDAQQGTLLVVNGHLDVTAAALKRLVQVPAAAAAAADMQDCSAAPVLVQWHGVDKSRAAVGATGTCSAACKTPASSCGASDGRDVTVVLRARMLREGMEVVL